MIAEVNISHLDLTYKVEFEEQKSHGGYSDIFQGTYSSDDGRKHEVAIKALRVQGSSDTPAARGRLVKHFYREILLWKRFQHPNIAPLLGYILLDNKPPALVSPWYMYGNVISYLEQHPDASRDSLALDVVEGLQYLHSFPVAHGDLKGENVLVNGEKRASLCDFGMSQFLDEASRIAGFTTTNESRGGTDRYMCPELLEDMPKTTATDMWALGCLLVQILTDQLPYEHITRRQAVLFAIVRGDPPLTIRPDAISSLQWDYVRKCWSITPEDRPPVSELRVLLLPVEIGDLPSFEKLALRDSDEETPTFEKGAPGHSPTNSFSHNGAETPISHSTSEIFSPVQSSQADVSGSSPRLSSSASRVSKPLPSLPQGTSRSSESSPVYPLLSHLLHPHLLGALLPYLSFEELLPLLSLNKHAKQAMESTRDIKELILETYLSSTIGYVRWSPKRMGSGDEPLSLTLRDLNSYMRGISIPSDQYGSVADAAVSALKSSTVTKTLRNQVRVMASSTRAYTRVVIRLRAQAGAVASHRAPPLSSSSTMRATGRGTRPAAGYYSQKQFASTGGSNHPYQKSSGSEVSTVNSSSQSSDTGTKQHGVSHVSSKFESPLYRTGYAPLLKVFVPSPDGAWLSTQSVQECEQELQRAGVEKLLEVGDIVWDVAAGQEYNTGRMIWDGNYLVDLDYTYSLTGDVPENIDSLAFSPSYWWKVVQLGGNPVCYINLAPFAVDIANNLQLLQDRVQNEVTQDPVIRWVHRTNIKIRPGMPVDPLAHSPDGTRQRTLIHPGWVGTLVIETEGTNEALADLQARSGDAVNASLIWRGSGGGSRATKNGKGIGRSPFRLLREKSRPGEIWLRCVGEKDRING